MTSIASWSTPQNPNPMGTMVPLGQTMANQLPAGIDPKAVAADPAGFAQWQQQKAAFEAGGNQTGGPTPGTAGTTYTPPPFGRVPDATGGQGGAQPFAAPYGTFQSYGPGNDLRGTAIMPQGGMADGMAQGVANFQFSPFQGVSQPGFGEERGMLAGANTAMQGLGFNFGGANTSYGNAVAAQQGAQGRAAGILSGLGGMGAGSFGGGAARADTGRFNQELDAALAGLQGPDRAALAAQTMGLLEERTQPGFEMAQRQTGQRAAALGRLGSGMTTNDLTGVLQDRERLLDQSRRQLATESAGQTLADRLQISGAQSAIAGQRFGGEQFNAGLADNAAARNQQGAMFGANLQRGVASDLYGMGRDAAGLQMDVGDRFGNQARDVVGLGERQAGFGRNIAGDLGNLTQGQFANAVGERNAARGDEFDRFGAGITGLNAVSGFERGQRQEARGERDFQNTMANDARANAIGQQQFSEWLRNSGWQRAMGAGSLGFGNDPSGALNAGAGAAGSNAANIFAMLGQLGQSFGQRG